MPRRPDSSTTATILGQLVTPATAPTLAARLGLTRQGVQRVLDQLIDQGRVVRGPRQIDGYHYALPGCEPSASTLAPAAAAMLAVLDTDRFIPLAGLHHELGIARTYAATLATQLAGAGLVEKVRRSGRPYLRRLAPGAPPITDATPTAPPPLVSPARGAILKCLIAQGPLRTAEIRKATSACGWEKAAVPLKGEIQILLRQGLIVRSEKGPGHSPYAVTPAGAAAAKYNYAPS